MSFKTAGQILYEQYLRSPHWQQLRREAFRKYGYKCSKCGSGSRPQPHHHFYRHPWESCTVDDLIILCRNCHRVEHGLEPLPQKPPYWKTKKYKRMMDRRESRRQNMIALRKKNFGAVFYKPPQPQWQNRDKSSN